MKVLLLRVGIDTTAGHWNAPAKLSSREFVYVPIPESTDDFRPNLERKYSEIEAVISAFGVKLPLHLRKQSMHLDPDFEHLTFGDQGSRGARIRKLEPGDGIAFFASFRPLDQPVTVEPLVYALIGFFRVGKIELATAVHSNLWHTNAHTRRNVASGSSDVVVFADPESSGRLERLIPIGEFRKKAYRVRSDLLQEWGGLDVTDGYIQRSAVPPFFNDGLRFCSWLKAQNIQLLQKNW